MSEEILRAAMYEGVSVDLIFEGYDANLDDLILIRDEWDDSFEDDDAFVDLENLIFDPIPSPILDSPKKVITPSNAVIDLPLLNQISFGKSRPQFGSALNQLDEGIDTRIKCWSIIYGGADGFPKTQKRLLQRSAFVIADSCSNTDHLDIQLDNFKTPRYAQFSAGIRWSLFLDTRRILAQWKTNSNGQL